MGSAQTTILGYGQPVAAVGEVTNRIDSASVVNKESTLNIGWGLGVKPGTGAREALLPTNGSGFLGFTALDRSKSVGTFGDVDQTSTVKGVKPNRQLEVITEGRGYVVVEADTVITPNVTRAFCRHTANGAGKLLIGAFRHDNDGGNANDVTNQVLFVGPVQDAVDILTGTTVKCAEVVVSRSNE